jgi:hypothetical protein
MAAGEAAATRPTQAEITAAKAVLAAAGDDAQANDNVETDNADAWLDLAPGDGTVKSANRMPYDALRFECMRGTGRVWACDGYYVAYRPFNHELDKAANPAVQERHANFLASGHYKHVGTYDEVQIFELLDGSPFKTVKRDYIVGRDFWADIRQAAEIACRREWVDFHDFLEAMAKGIKHDRTPNDQHIPPARTNPGRVLCGHGECARGARTAARLDCAAELDSRWRRAEREIRWKTIGCQ